MQWKLDELEPVAVCCSACRSIQHIKGDRNDYDNLRRDISGRAFDVVYDINGREAEQVAPILEAIPDLAQYIYCSSAGVYLKSDQMPHRRVASSFVPPLYPSSLLCSLHLYT
jgi:hypothetical protein